MLAVMWMMRVMSFQVQEPDIDCNAMLATRSEVMVAHIHPELLEEVVGPLDRLLPSHGAARQMLLSAELAVVCFS